MTFNNAASQVTFQIGEATVTRVTEMTLDEVPKTFLYPEWDDALTDAHRHWLIPGNMRADGAMLRQSIHTWVVRTPRHTILIDTASGNDKERPLNPLFHHLQTPYLSRLSVAGVKPEDVDFVFSTHLHVDHVGWNTYLKDGRWHPTFPNAQYVFSEKEFAFYSDPDNVQPPSVGVFEDSVQPIFESGQARMIAAGCSDVLDGFLFHGTQGHSYDHLSISFTSEGKTALFGGDLMHHPIQVVRPEWNSVFCEFQEAARVSRRWALDFVAERDAIYFSSHFAETSAGRIAKDGERYKWTYALGNNEDATRMSIQNVRNEGVRS